ncbi:MAG: chorismate synthase [Deltaproteobacteria bacterium]|nr:chorismate synthase [Deltaproteobacteria bacterium]MBW1909883.1 chorismate synthase [Deltaproteobacteria bacterium]MBW2032827.1 chorismate synthase [Deltaproteobacteria bacterium]MBW2113888.1 chorismate synthase [Deltaproteobacteria bacterium]MBW2357116.1 chorismate synthase [Deltaproteobacteria bacterium]
MAGSSFGKIFKITTFGESHGAGVGVVIDGCPPRISLSPENFVRDMARRRPGRHILDTPRSEGDQVEILSGVFEGLTTGAPITLFIRNQDADSRPYEILRQVFRPGHADYTYFKKYGHFDFRGGGRYSARETAARVAAGVVAGEILSPLGVKVVAYTLELGGVRAESIDMDYVEKSPLCCPDPVATERMEEVMSRARKEGDSLGGIAEVHVRSCPAGFGEPVFDKLDADLAKAVMSIGTVKGVEVGAGFEAARFKGSENNDPITPDGFRSNRAGGILGGISNGDEIILRAAMKPIPSISREQDTLDRKRNPAKLKFEGRHDVAAIPRIIPALEAMVKIVLADHYLRSRTMNNLSYKNPETFKEETRC